MTDSPEPREPKTPPLDAATLGAFVARVRTARGLTQRQLAERLYVSDKTVSKWERGLSLPSVPLLVPLAGALGLSISELMACEEAPHEERLGRAEADRLIAASLDLSGATPTGRQRVRRLCGDGRRLGCAHGSRRPPAQPRHPALRIFRPGRLRRPPHARGAGVVLVLLPRDPARIL